MSFVVSTAHGVNFGKAFVAHIGVRAAGGINFMPICGWRANGPTRLLGSNPGSVAICFKCMRRHRSTFGSETPLEFSK